MQSLITASTIHTAFDVNDPLVLAALESIISTTKENIIIRRWWVEEAIDPSAKVFSYIHTGNQLAVLLTVKASTVKGVQDERFIALGNDLAMQVAAMGPIAISSDHLSAEDKARQQSIFETQLTDAGKPEASWNKIMPGKFQKYYSECCLLEQESVLVPKSLVKDIVAKVSKELGEEIIIVNMIRCQVGEGLVKEKSDLADEVAKLV
jgi:elongation factor Ts